MPLIRYHFKDGDRVFHEDHIVAPKADYVSFGNSLAKQLEAKMESAEPLNPYLHTHSWIITRSSRQAGTNYDIVRCKVCNITGRHRSDSMTVDRDKPYNGEKFFYCHEPLKKLKPMVVKRGAVMPRLNPY